jgi:carbon storage regulator
MLVLSRKTGESIVINNNITVTVLKVCGNTVSIGVEAPEQVPVHRQEVWDKIHKPPSEAAPPQT